ncbi:hypothetical protein JJB07_16360 [Tumebacillus sp. ITR2]|uniref:Peptide ABC transporter substrate-binding protein n=1 Tax=Tumebacillus amylolyticus TaxID=2801339 RepID=A0ABS1JD28_9BACL|nr:ABC transporter substrate-binding protein [Tumebacillus amylolyticus]MBL0388192.1 hypothetical protein [Tumebacillus amylolyticus]
MKSWMKHTVTAFGAISLLTIPGLASAAPHVTLNGTAQVYDTDPYQKNGRTLVPMRAIFEALGASIQWDEETKQVTGTKGTTTVVLQVGSTKATVNGQEVTLNQAAEQTNDRVMVPIRFISEALGADVKWDEATETVRIYSKDMADKVIHLGLSEEINSLDPAVSYSNNDQTVIQQVTEGLIRLDRSGNLQPGVAKAWDVSADGLHYTFHLRGNAKWSDGSAVTAHDFEYAWKRALNSETLSQWAFQFFGIENAQKYTERKGAVEDVGIHAKDDLTLEVTLAASQSHFMRLVTLPMFAPVKESNPTLNNGPYKLQSLDNAHGALLVKNDAYWNRDQVRLEQIDFQVEKDIEAAGRAYESGWLDSYTAVPSKAPQRDVQSVPQAAAYYLQYNENVEALQSPKVRRALTYAVDNQAFADSLLGAGAQGADGFVPTGVSDGFSGSFRQKAGDQLHQAENAKQANLLLQEGLKELGLSGLPKFKMLLSDTDASRKSGELLKQAWHDNLGLDVEVDYQPYKLVLQAQYAKNYDIALGAWQADYDDPTTFLDLWVSSGDFNNVNYRNQKYDELMTQIHKEVDFTKRTELMIQAEKLLLDDMVIGPVYFKNRLVVSKPYVKGVQFSPIYAQYDLKDAYIEGKN